VSSVPSAQKCANCQSHKSLQSAAVRLYFKRSQWEYRYRLCGECLKQLKMFLWANAENAQGGMFDPPSDRIEKSLTKYGVGST
jgi:hypothetical protein